MNTALRIGQPGDGLAQRTPLYWARRHCAGAAARGLSPDALLGACHLDADAPDAALTSNQFALLCIRLILDLGDELQGSSTAAMPVGSVAMGVRLMLGAERLEDGLREMLRFFNLIAPAYGWNLDTRDDQAVLEVGIATPEGVEVLPGEEILIAGLHMYMSWYAGRVVPIVSAVTSSPDHPALTCADQAAFLKCPTVLGRRTAIVFPRACLGWARRAADRDRPVSQSVRFALENIWSADAFSFGRPQAGSGRAADVLQALEDDPHVNFVDLAEAWGMTPITLWRQLKAEGTSFLKLRRTWLTRRAIELLRGTDGTAEDLADALGFSDARSFRHALKMVTGLRPSDIRARNFDFAAWEAGQEAVRADILSLCERLDA